MASTATPRAARSATLSPSRVESGRTVTSSEPSYIQLATTGDGRALITWIDTRLHMALYRSGVGFVAAAPLTLRAVTAGQHQAGGIALTLQAHYFHGSLPNSTAPPWPVCPVIPRTSLPLMSL